MRANPQTSKKITIFAAPIPSLINAQNKRSSIKIASMFDHPLNEIIISDYNRLMETEMVILVNLIKR